MLPEIRHLRLGRPAIVGQAHADGFVVRAGLEHHPVVGELNLTFEAMELVADPGLTMFVYTAEPGSKSEQALNLLASWTATPDQETTHADHEEQPRHHSGT